jgi:hypothetical protein
MYHVERNINSSQDSTSNLDSCIQVINIIYGSQYYSYIHTKQYSKENMCLATTNTLYCDECGGYINDWYDFDQCEEAADPNKTCKGVRRTTQRHGGEKCDKCIEKEEEKRGRR